MRIRITYKDNTFNSTMSQKAYLKEKIQITWHKHEGNYSFLSSN